MSNREKAIVAVLLVGLSWSLSPLAMKYLTRHLDLYTQNFIRFAAASAVLWAICLVRRRRQVLAGWRTLGRLLPAAAAAFAHQVCFVQALYTPDLYPGLAYLVGRSTVLFTAVLSYLFFADERSIIRDWRFGLGVLLSLVGVLGFLPRGGASVAEGGVGLGVLLILASAISWAVYAILIKHVVREGSALVSYTYVCSLMTLAFTVLSFGWGEPARLIPHGAEGVWVLVIAIGSGALSVGVAHALYYYSIRGLGPAVCTTVMLVNTFVPLALSALLFGERLALVHLIFGLVLLIGCAVTLQARPRRA